MDQCIIPVIKNKKARDVMAKGLIASCLGMLVMACSGCGGGGSDTNPPSTQAAAPAKNVLIEEYGDSTTQGLNVDPSNTDPAVTQNILQQKFGPTVAIENDGVAGTEAVQLLNGSDGVHLAWMQQMANSKADIVTLNFGMNESYYINPQAVQTATSVVQTPDQFAATLTQLVQIAQAAGKKVALFEPNPSCDPIRVPYLPSYVQAIRTVASALNVPVVPEYDYVSTLDWQSLTPDCIHPGAQLYAIKAAQEVNVLTPIVGNLLGVASH